MASTSETKSETQFQRESAALDWMPAVGGRGARVFVKAEAAGGTSRDVAELGLDRPDLANRFARLFAASGELLAAAERALKLLQEENAQRCPEEWLEVTDLRQAVAKARGEEPRVQADADRDRGFPVCGALRGMESWQPTCSLPTGHEGPHRWGTP